MNISLLQFQILDLAMFEVKLSLWSVERWSHILWLRSCIGITLPGTDEIGNNQNSGTIPYFLL